jgi:hypothetical protein
MATAETKSVGRAPSPETIEYRKTIKKMAARKNGVTNIELAAELGLTTLRTSALATAMVNAGELKATKAENGRVTYTKAAKVLEAA